MTKYCVSLFRYVRRDTVPVSVGNVVLGGGHPIRIQSMGNTDTNDTAASAAQALRIAAAGGELVRFTAQGRTEARNLGAIRRKLRETGCSVPLVADIHFNPAAALAAAEEVEKVRINPGNFVDKRADFTRIDYTDEAYAAELTRLREKFVALLDVCRAHGTALRIGVNHGSLSDRIMSRYGDTPPGMVESAMEFLRICRDEGFDRAAISMKSSNVRVMVQAYRLLAAAMLREGMRYPLHLGVTEAGDGEDARVKSAAGIGAQLADGLGDTVRVSLTEPPENEIPVARKLVDYFAGRENHDPIPEADETFYHPYEYVKRRSVSDGTVGGDRPPVVVADGPRRPLDPMPDLFAEDAEAAAWLPLDIHGLTPVTLARLRENPRQAVVLDTRNRNGVAEQRAFFLKLAEHGLENPVVIRRSYAETDLETLQLKAAADLGPLLIDGFGNGIWIRNDAPGIGAERIVSLAYSILQATRVRISRTEYIACPSCGRTLFDLQRTLALIRGRTSHLKGLKIGVMGCIVNGPGEMADADYGYVGAGPGRVTLYKGKEVVKRNIPQEEALEELVALIRASGDWREPEADDTDK